ncbi:E3 ubiquitin-protein ligase TRIM33-like [Mercenaria mercenaria]|uniref:E3 ubiquitin-protein ligase TRIM33-like n=1 Tax=Mercenaria mercenaria TaxID=6596 RepID=UPI00234E5A33|nr:E3 ubiquitin-protein ligase TRIM33-like [Mercenaria mercenaria]
MATGGCEETSDEIFNFKYTPCSRINRQRKAVKYCVECQGYCCQSCVDTHQAFPTLVGHKLLDKSTGLSADFPVVPTEICSIHKIKILDMYCGTHDVVGCTSCMALEHRSCTDVQLISDIAETMYKKKDVDELNLTLKEKKSEVEKVKTSREVLLEELNESKTNAVNAIKAFREDMEKILQNLEKESIKEVEKEFQTMETMLLEEIQISENQMKNLSKAADDMKQSDGNIAQQFVSMKTTQKRLAQTEDILNDLDTHVHAKVSFAADQTVLGFLQQLKTFGSVIRNTVYSVKGTRDMNIKVQSDSSAC